MLKAAGNHVDEKCTRKIEIWPGMSELRVEGQGNVTGQ
jgi:hypothetical protein